MADINLHIPDEHVDRVVHALCRAAGWPPDEESPAKARAHLIKILRDLVHACEAEEAAEKDQGLIQ